MKPIYTEVKSPTGGDCITAEYEDGRFQIIPCDPANSDYQRYLRWLEDPEAEENGTIS
jgi:hypothetical protein